MIKGNHNGSDSKVKIYSPSHLGESLDPNNDLDLPNNSEDTVTILSEMNAQKAIFDTVFSTHLNKVRVMSCAKSTLKLLSHNPENFETKLLIFCLNYCIGNICSDLIPERTSETRWTRKVFETLSIGWMRWMVSQNDDEVLCYIANMFNDEPRGEDKSFDILILSFWAKAIELMMLNRPLEAMKFFDRANEVGAQIGTSLNPSICWTYATSFYRMRNTR
jgi:hypothetical protein